MRLSFERVEDWVARVNLVFARVSGWLILVIALLCCYGVFTRYVLVDPDTWSYEVAAYLLGFVVYFAIGDALQQNIHVRVDLFQEMFPGRFARVTRIIGDMLCLAFLWVLFGKVWFVFHDSLVRGRIDETTLGWPVAAVQWVMPFGVGMMMVVQLVMLIGRIRRLS
jgi:TRAP-type C4-dicarboxylate transport system permease small subunit